MKMPVFNILRFLKFTLLCWGIIPGFVMAQENNLYDFNVESFSKKTWEWKGELTLTGATRQYNTDSVLYDFKFQGDRIEQSEEGELKIFLESRWDWDVLRLVISGEAAAYRSTRAESDEDSSFLSEGYGQLTMLDPHTLELGKRLLRWGKGYAFNPVAFLERPKNPEDPEESREGLWITQGIWITGNRSVFDNSSVTIAYLPVRDEVNDGFRAGVSFENAWGLKWYGLIDTTDIDLYLVRWLEEEETNWGADFASNLTTNFEIHGEYAVFETVEKTNHKALLGLRYLTENEITWIVEGFYDSAGFDQEELSDLYKTIASGNPVQVKTALSQVQQSRTISRNYAYFKVSIKEPFNWLYFTPSVSWLANMDDSSQTGTIQLIYAPFENWTFQASYQQSGGAPDTQWGENAVGSKLSLDLVYSL